jgi:thioredoxin 1
MSKMMMVQLSVGLIVGGSIGALLGYFGKCSTGACPLTANPVRGMMVGAVLGAMFSFSVVPTESARALQEENTALVHIDTVADFQSLVLQSKQPVLVDFYSNACSPCRRLSPVISQLADQFAGRAVVAKVNVDRLSELAGQHQIQSIPAVLFYENGEETKRIIGYNTQAVYATQLEAMIGANVEPLS